MAFKTIIFNDDEENEMECFLNEENKIMIIISDLQNKNQNYIKLNPSEIQEVIDTLKNLSIQNNGPTKL